jgi:hypothetical protein
MLGLRCRLALHLVEEVREDMEATVVAAVLVLLVVLLLLLEDDMLLFDFFDPEAILTST